MMTAHVDSRQSRGIEPITPSASRLSRSRFRSSVHRQCAHLAARFSFHTCKTHRHCLKSESVLWSCEPHIPFRALVTPNELVNRFHRRLFLIAVQDKMSSIVGLQCVFVNTQLFCLVTREICETWRKHIHFCNPYFDITDWRQHTAR